MVVGLGAFLGRLPASGAGDERVGGDRPAAAVLRDDVRVCAREDLDRVAHLLGDLLEREPLLGEAEAGVGVAEEVRRRVWSSDGDRGRRKDARRAAGALGLDRVALPVLVVVEPPGLAVCSR